MHRVDSYPPFRNLIKSSVPLARKALKNVHNLNEKSSGVIKSTGSVLSNYVPESVSNFGSQMSSTLGQARKVGHNVADASINSIHHIAVLTDEDASKWQKIKATASLTGIVATNGLAVSKLPFKARVFFFILVHYTNSL